MLERKIANVFDNSHLRYIFIPAFNEILRRIGDADCKADDIQVYDEADFSWYPQTAGYTYELCDWYYEHIGFDPIYWKVRFLVKEFDREKNNFPMIHYN
jgi:hypothetical protein